VLKNTVTAERRERVIEAQIAAGVNVVICNPELVKTRLDLIYFPTLIFYEITFNLGTMMQAAARSYRLNQTHTHCRTYYLFAEHTMEHTAVQLMSRKQRAAKLLTGDVGLTGLDALTEGEGGFEEALLDAIVADEVLLDPSELFKVGVLCEAADAEDAAYWNVEVSPAAAAGALTAAPTEHLPVDRWSDAEPRTLLDVSAFRLSSPRRTPSKRRPRLDLLAVPDDAEREAAPLKRPPALRPVQRTLF